MKIVTTSHDGKNINFSMQIKNKTWWSTLNRLSDSGVQNRLLIKEAEALADAVEDEILKTKRNFASAFKKVSKQKKYQEMSHSARKDICEVLKYSWIHGEKIPKNFYEKPSRKKGILNFFVDFL